MSHQPYLSRSFSIFKEFKLLRVSDIFQLKRLTFAYEFISNTNPSCFHEFFHFSSPVHSHKTRQSNRGDIFMAQPNSSLDGLKSIRYLGAKLWNELPVEARNSSHRTLFKKS